MLIFISIFTLVSSEKVVQEIKISAPVMTEEDQLSTIMPKAVNYTRNEWRRCETTLETGGEDV
jgi:hypothetical protein